MPAVFDKLGIQFDYPDNWSLEEDVDLESSNVDEGQQVVVSGPGTAFWHLSKYPPDAELEVLFDEALAALRAEYRDIEVELVDEIIEDCHLSGFDVNFYCLDLTSTTWLRGFQTDDATYMLICQAEDQELQNVGPVFRAMWTSLLRRVCG